MSEQEAVLDELLEKLGSWGKYQRYYYVCLGFVVAYSVFSMSFIFTARDIRYRCLIPECDTTDPVEYNSTWLQGFVPYKEGFPNRCLQYDYKRDNIVDTCSNITVNKNVTLECREFVYERTETTIIHDFHIHCNSNLWKLTIVGTVNVIGELVCLSYTGFISDRFGRKLLMILSVLLSMTIGVLRSFSINYIMYISLEFLDTALSGGMYGSAFILAMELVESKERNKGNAIISCLYAFGQILMGLVAMISPSWRVMLRILYLFGLFSLVFFWTVSESVRWLISTGRKDKAKNILKRIAKTNGKDISDSFIDGILNNTILCETSSESATTKTEKETFRDVLKSKLLCFRIMQCSYMWICCTFVYYGLTIHSVSISKNTYASFIFTAAIEIPGYIIYYFINEKCGRRKVMFGTLILGGISCIAVGFLSDELFWCNLVIFLLGKCCMTIAYTLLYVYTTELFPTCSRHSMFSICSMFGRFGSMIAPQVPLLATITTALPLILFGVLASSSGALVLLLPETLNIKLPDTIDEAVNIGRKDKRHQSIERNEQQCDVLISRRNDSF